MRVKIEATYENQMKKYRGFLAKEFAFQSTKEGNTIELHHIEELLPLIEGLRVIDRTKELVVKIPRDTPPELVIEIYNGYRE